MVIALLFPSLHLLANNIKWPKIDQQLLEFHSKGLICERSQHHIEIKEIGILKAGENRSYRTNISKWDIFSEFQTCYLPILNEKQPQMETPSGRSLLHNLKVFLDPLRLLAKMKTNGGPKDFCKKAFLSCFFLFVFWEPISAFCLYVTEVATKNFVNFQGRRETRRITFFCKSLKG